jgi:glycosyltransferase involved in cell wall biosynthesis
MRILHCISNLIHGGAQRQLSYLASELTRRGHQVHVAYLDGGPNLARLLASQVEVHRLVRRNNHDLTILWQLLRLIKDSRPDIVHTWIGQMDIVGGIAATLTRTPWIIREASSGPAYPNTWKYLLRRWVVSQAAAIVSNSSRGDLYWQKYYKDKSRYIIPNGLPLQEIETASPGAKDELGLPPSKKIVLFVGRFDLSKYKSGVSHVRNLDNFLMALAHLRDDPDIVSVFCGDGPRKPAIRQMVKQLGISDRVLLLGFVDNVWPLMKLADVFVSVSHFEGFPNSVLEAMACGCPLVVSDIPAHREFLDESRALLVNRFQPEDIARAIKQTLTHPEEAQRRAQMAKDLVQRWTMATMVEKYERVYSDILRSKHLNDDR